MWEASWMWEAFFKMESFTCYLMLFDRSAVSDSLWPHGLQHARLPCPSPSPRLCSNSYPLSQWYHPTISSSVTHFSSCLHSFPASASFPMSWLFASESEVTQSCPTLWDPMDSSLPGFSIHGIFQAKILEWVAIYFCRRSSWPRDQTRVSCFAGRLFTILAIREAPI